MAVIEVKNFAKSFAGKLVHSKVNFQIEKGECVGLVGGSGAGKSVILRSLIGLEKPDSGQIFINGQEISRLSEADLRSVRREVAYVFQNGALFDSMSVHENLAYPLRAHFDMTEEEISQRISEQLGEFGLQNTEHLYPAELSGGMQKRVGIARAIISRPNVVLYDEPTAGLDPHNTLKIQEMALRLKQRGVTSVLVTHDMPTAFAVCDRIYLLMGGETRAHGTIADLRLGTNNLLNRFISGQEV